MEWCSEPPLRVQSHQTGIMLNVGETKESLALEFFSENLPPAKKNGGDDDGDDDGDECQHPQPGRQDLEESDCLCVTSPPSAMLALSLGMCLQTLLKGLTTPTSSDWPDLGLVF